MKGENVMNLYDLPANMRVRWASFENPKGDKGCGGLLNGGAKGHAFDSLGPGATVALAQIGESGVIRRIWITVSNRTEEVLRDLELRAYWDDSPTPSVCCPLANFFGFALNRLKAFESELFSSPEGRSFNCFIPMPFSQSARITLTNNSDKAISHVFYDIDYTLEPIMPGNFLYFHTYTQRQIGGTLHKDLAILPKVKGKGRFLGMSVGVQLDPIYEGSWWGEGEVKMYLDGDITSPTLVGTGVEDYIGTAWGQGTFSHRTQGCLEADFEEGRFCFYRFHTIDPIVFKQDLEVGLQTIGGAPCDKIMELQKQAPMRIISSDGDRGFEMLNHPEGFVVDDLNRTKDNAWYNFYREDDYTWVAYFYLDRT